MQKQSGPDTDHLPFHMESERNCVMRKLENIYQTLYSHYGDLNWRSAVTPYEVIVGAILTQNTDVYKRQHQYGESPSFDYLS